MTITGDMLPRVAAYQVSTDHNRNLSAPSQGGMLYLNRTDSVVQPFTYSVSWTDRTAEHVEVIWQHYQAHAAGVFKWIGPGSSIESTWRWLSAPTVNWTSATTATVVADVEPVLAFIP